MIAMMALMAQSKDCRFSLQLVVWASMVQSIGSLLRLVGGMLGN